MDAIFDSTGFPLISVPESGFYMQLLPVLRVQFERFVATPNRFNDDWYEQILAANPRHDMLSLASETRENMFITGLLTDEIISFSQWLGDRYTAPTVAQWRTAYQSLQRIPFHRDDLDIMLLECNSPQAIDIINWMVEVLAPVTWLDLSAMNRGLVEWVKDDGNWVGLGAPRPEFFSNLWDPMYDVVIPISIKERLPYFGFRLIKLS